MIIVEPRNESNLNLSPTDFDELGDFFIGHAEYIDTVYLNNLTINKYSIPGSTRVLDYRRNGPILDENSKTPCTIFRQRNDTF